MVPSCRTSTLNDRPTVHSHTLAHLFGQSSSCLFELGHIYNRGVVVEWWYLVPSVRKVADSNPTLADT